ncbi:MAG TPA: DUF4139 domain-containing protein, partial [Polyangiaceae bacterium]|nr:DUF4139 domain-containing protein [Polyangiaceae bacterium]
MSRIHPGLFCVIATFAFGCARGPNVSTEQLPLRKVVVYRNGVGYFERSGSVDSERVTFNMRGSMVGDFLATLAVVERGGNSVRAASFPLKLEELEEPAPEPKPRGRHEPALSPVEGPPPPPKPKDPLREVALELDGKDHELLVGYVSRTPVWRPSYRVVIQKDGKALLQAWGVVQNLSGEDWQDVELSLVAGAPLAFESTLGTPVIPQRPVVTDQGEVILEVPQGSTSLAEMAAPMAAPAPPPTAEAPAMAYDEEQSAMSSGAGVASGGPGGFNFTDKKAAMAKPMPSSAAMRQSLTLGGLGSDLQRVNALANVAVQGSNTVYALPSRVTVPNDSATMVLLLNQTIPGESVFLFSPDPGVPDSAAHPFRVA